MIQLNSIDLHGGSVSRSLDAPGFTCTGFSCTGVQFHGGSVIGVQLLGVGYTVVSYTHTVFFTETKLTISECRQSSQFYLEQELECGCYNV